MNQVSLVAARIDAAKYVDVHALRNVLVVALVAGTGITVLFAVAARSLSAEGPDGPTLVNRLVAGLCLLVVAVAVASGVWAVLAK